MGLFLKKVLSLCSSVNALLKFSRNVCRAAHKMQYYAKLHGNRAKFEGNMPIFVKNTSSVWVEKSVIHCSAERLHSGHKLTNLPHIGHPFRIKIAGKMVHFYRFYTILNGVPSLYKRHFPKYYIA